MMNLLADIGGTHARFMLVSPVRRSQLPAPVILRTDDYPDFASALGAFLVDQRPTGPVERAAVCVAGPVEQNRARLTNCPWQVDAASIKAATGATRVVLLNDFAAIALALPSLTQSELQQIGGGIAVPGANRAVIGPGTGLGVCGLLEGHRGELHPIAGEGGHVDLAPGSDREAAVLTWMRHTLGHVSAEHVLSGPGLERLYQTLRQLDAAVLPNQPQAQSVTAKQIVSLGLTEPDGLAAEALSLFSGWLGAVAGNLALTLGARGGVFLAGGIVRQWGPAFDAARFRTRFEAKECQRDYLRAIPTWLITAPHPAFQGLTTLL